MEPSRLTDLLAEQVRHNEAQVLAEQTLRAERIIGWVRVAMVVGLLLAVFVARTVDPASLPVRDALRPVVAGGYALWALILAVALGRMKSSPRKQLYGPLVSTVVDFGFATFMVLRGVFVEGRIDAGMIVGVGCVLIAFAVFRFSYLYSVLNTVLALATGGVCLWIAAARGVRVEVIGFTFGAVSLVLVGVLVAAANRAIRRMFVDLRRRENLARFLPRQVAERVLRLAGAPLAPVQREVTILFVDVRDFTALSERLPPREVLDFLSNLLGELSQIVKGRDGVVNKFLGDGMLAVWGVPEQDDDHAAHAVRAAQDMLIRVAELSAAQEAAGKAAIRIGIGIHTGTVAAGMVGGADQHEYTVIGDAVNLASRIEGLTKTYGCPLLVSETTAGRLGDRFALRPVADAQVKGRVQSVKVFAIEAAAGGDAEPRPGSARTSGHGTAA